MFSPIESFNCNSNNDKNFSDLILTENKGTLSEKKGDIVTEKVENIP